MAVLGMHRSGTSAIARALRLLGVELGSKLHPPGFDNPKGFWEDSEVVAINEDLLKAINSSYDQLDLAWDGVSGDQEAINELRIRATSLLGERLASYKIWGFKDPRTCRLIRFWKPIIESSGAECRVVLALRNPLSSAISLQKRNGLPIEKGCFLWLQHVLPSVLDPLGKKVIAVDYDLLMQSPFEQLERMAKGLGLSLAAEDEPAVAEYVQDFLDDGLRHTHFSVEQTALDSRVPSDVLAVYEILLGAARDEDLIHSRKLRYSLGAIQNRLTAYSQSFGYANSLEEDRHKLYLVVNERDQHLSILNQEIAERDDMVVRLKEAESALNNQIRSLGQMVEDRAAAELEARRALHESETRLQQLIVAMADIQKVIGERTAAELEAKRALLESEVRIQQLDMAVADIQTVTKERTAAELEARHALHESETRLQQLIVAMADIQKVIGERTSAELEAKRALLESEVRIQQLDMAVADIQKVAKERTAAELEARRALHESEARIQQLSVAMADIQKVIGERTAAELAAKRALLESEARLQQLNSVLDGRQRETDHLVHLNAESATARDKLQKAIGKLESQEALLQAALRSSNQETLAKAQVVADRDHYIARLYACISERDARVSDLNRSLDRKSDFIRDIKETLALGQVRIHGLEVELAERAQTLEDLEISTDIKVAGLKHELAERAQTLEDLKLSTDIKVAELQHELAAGQSLVDRLENDLEESNDALLDTRAQRDDLIRQNGALNTALTAAQIESQAFRQGVTDREREIAQILSSASWRITKPIRLFRKVSLARPTQLAKKWVSDTCHKMWWNLPIGSSRKQRLKGYIFSTFPTFFSWSQAYRSWKSLTAPWKAPVHAGPEHSFQLREVPQEAGPDYVPIYEGVPPKNKPVRLICFYLPQFHAIPENDEWWGEGFTEWSNVRPALPQFEGHCQPRIPGELGYYNLLDPDVQARQVELAKLYGIEGFCFYFYWFGGKRLLEAPILNYLANENLDLPFCLCWANENWSRRWDGLDSEILIAQNHSKDDDLAFIAHVAEYMRDSRYIRVGGKPLLLVYRPSLLPDPKATAARWRNWCRENGIGEVLLAYTQSFETVSPADYGFDAAIEFPPNNSSPPNITESVVPLQEDFGVTVYDWKVFVERSERYTNPGYKVFRSVCPSWDNTARRRNFSTVFKNSEPALYQRWLENAIDDTIASHQDPSERLVFVNAWNEWAEGAHLEPDAQYGYAYLQATRNALASAENFQRSILLVTHDCHPHGAQFLILAIAKQLKLNGFKVAILALGEGRLLDDFTSVGETHNALAGGEAGVHDFLAKVRSQGVVDAITSTVVCGGVVPQLKFLGFRVLSLIHELPGVIHQMKQEANAGTIAKLADKIVFPASMVFQRFCEIAPVTAEQVVIRPQGVLRKNPYKNRRAEAYRMVCEKHNLPPNTQIVLSIAYVDSRKGPDLFVEIAARVLRKRPQTVFIWIGHAEREMERQIQARIQELGLQESVLFIGFDRDPMAYYAATSVYALPSREDPFPNVVLESAEVGVPVVAFEGASGAGDFILEHGGRLARPLDIDDFARKLCELLGKPPAKGQKRVDSMQQYSLDLLHHLNEFPRISVVVPNYNYREHIIDRMESILRQSFPIYEMIVLDDASTDDSVEILQKYMEDTNNEAQLIVNNSNAGSVFRQWQKGISYCKGDLIWIAEADDLSDAGFLGALAPPFDVPELAMAYCQSKQIDENGTLLASNYLDYTKHVSDRWLTEYIRDGREEIAEALCIKNTIPNVSAVLFRRQALNNALLQIGDEIYNYRVAGDWLIYLHVLLQGKVFFCKEPLNLHRRHTRSVTNSTDKHGHLEEVIKLQAIARALVAPCDEVREKAATYIEHLHEHFEIPRKGTNGL